LSRLSGRLFIFVWAALLLGATGAKAAPVSTLVQDKLYRADGQATQGTLTIRWNAFSTSAGEAVPAGEMTATTDATGRVAIPLIPNTGSSPAGSYYRVFLKLDDGTTSEELWVVPAVSTTTIAAIRAKVVPQAVAAQFASRDYVDTALAAVAPQSLVHLAGAETISGAKTFTVSPEVPAPTDAGGAADKGYVDQQIGGLATVASTGSYNDLVNKPTGANLSAPGAIGSTNPGTVNATAYSVNGVPLSSVNLSDASALAKMNQANTFSQPQTVQSSITLLTPAADIRAYGAVIDGVTDSSAAILSAVAAACPSSGVVYLPCGGSGCYAANLTGLAAHGTAACNSGGGEVHIKLQGVLTVGTTLILADGLDISGEGGGYLPQFLGMGTTASIEGKGTVGTMGTTFASGARTFTPSSMNGIVPNAGITVAGTVSCAVSSVARAGNIATATLSSGCRIPPGASMTVSGVTDTAYNGTFFVAASDYGLNTVSWNQTGSNSTSSGGTVVGLNEDSIETVNITATTSSTATATFAHAHSSSDVFGVVVIATPPGSAGHESMESISVGYCGGACLWGDYTFYWGLDKVGLSSGQNTTSIPLVLSSSSDVTITRSVFNAAAGFPNPGLPWGIYMSEVPAANMSGNSTGNIKVSDSWIQRGVQITSGGVPGISQEGMIVTFDKDTFERAAYAVRVEPNPGGGLGIINIIDPFQQDDLDGFLNPCTIAYSDFSGSGGGAYIREADNSLTPCRTAGYFDGSLQVEGLPGTLPSYAVAPKGNWNDGRAQSTEITGSGAGMSPQLVPYATANIPDPTTWTSAGCTVTQGVTAPDGSTTAAALSYNTGGYNVAGTANYATNTGDYFIYGEWVKGNFSSGGFPFWLISYGTNDVFLDSGNATQAYPGAFISGFPSTQWTPVVAVAQFKVGDGGTHLYQFLAGCPSSGNGSLDHWGPFLIHLPASTPVAEVQRIRQDLLHGYVPPNLPGGQILAMNPNHKLYWGSDTNLYRGAAGVVQTDGGFAAGTTVTTPSLTLNGGTPITGQSSANSQVVTCPSGGTSTQYCGADGAWHASGGSSLPSSVLGQSLQSNGSAYVSSFNAPFYTASGLDTFGDSDTFGTGPTYISQSWANLVANSFGAPFVNFGTGGDWAADMAVKVFENTAPGYSLAPNVTAMIGTNDANVCGYSAGCEANYTSALTAAVSAAAIPQMNKVYGQSCTTTSGTTAADNTLPGVPALKSTTNGTVMTCTTAGGAAVDVAWRAIDSNGGTATLTIDGVSQGTLNAFGNNSVNIATQNGLNNTIFAKEYAVASASSHTVVLTVTSATSASNIFSVVYAATPMASMTTVAPPRVYIMGVAWPTGATAYNTIASNIAAAYAADGLPVQFVPVIPRTLSADGNVTPTNVSGRALADVVTTTGSAATTVTSASANFGRNSVGQLLEINGAGTSGGWLDSYITAYVNQTTVTINTPALTAGTGLTAYFGSVGQVCGANTSSPSYLHGNNCWQLHVRDALLAVAQPTSPGQSVNPVFVGSLDLSGLSIFGESLLHHPLLYAFAFIILVAYNPFSLGYRSHQQGCLLQYFHADWDNCFRS
jgi:hypothetical protein